MEPEGSLPHSKELATCPYPEPDQSSPRTPTHFLKIHFNITVETFDSRSSAWTVMEKFRDAPSYWNNL